MGQAAFCRIRVSVRQGGAVELGELAGEGLELCALGPVVAADDAVVVGVGVDRLQHAVGGAGPRRDPDVVGVEVMQGVALAVGHRQRSAVQRLSGLQVCAGDVRVQEAVTTLSSEYVASSLLAASMACSSPARSCSCQVSTLNTRSSGLHRVIGRTRPPLYLQHGCTSGRSGDVITETLPGRFSLVACLGFG